MNIFVTNTDPVQCAHEHCYVHLTKMIIESAQLLSTCHRMYGNDDPRLCSLTHVNHPCAVWVRESRGNYEWLAELYVEMCLVYSDKKYLRHGTDLKRTNALLHPPSELAGGMTPFVQAMPDTLKDKDVTVAYQRYLNHKFREWQSREYPVPVKFPFGEPHWYKP